MRGESGERRKKVEGEGESRGRGEKAGERVDSERKKVGWWRKE